MLKASIMIIILATGMIPGCMVYAITPLDKVDVSNPRLVNGLGDPIGTKINVNQQLNIAAEITNNQDQNQQFIYIIQIKDATSKVVSLGWISGDLGPNQDWSPSLSWTPQSGGKYTVEIFVWDNFKNLSALTDVSTITITVS